KAWPGTVALSDRRRDEQPGRGREPVMALKSGGTERAERPGESLQQERRPAPARRARARGRSDREGSTLSRPSPTRRLPRDGVDVPLPVDAIDAPDDSLATDPRISVPGLLLVVGGCGHLHERATTPAR